MQDVLQDLAKNLVRSCTKPCKILQEVLLDLARNPADLGRYLTWSFKTSSKILHNNLAPACTEILQNSCTSKQSCKITSGKILQESGQITCKTTRLVQILRDHFQHFCSKTCSKILQAYLHWLYIHAPHMPTTLNILPLLPYRRLWLVTKRCAYTGVRPRPQLTTWPIYVQLWCNKY